MTDSVGELGRLTASITVALLLRRTAYLDRAAQSSTAQQPAHLPSAAAVMLLHITDTWRGVSGERQPRRSASTPALITSPPGCEAPRQPPVRILPQNAALPFAPECRRLRTAS